MFRRPAEWNTPVLRSLQVKCHRTVFPTERQRSCGVLLWWWMMIFDEQNYLNMVNNNAVKSTCGKHCRKSAVSHQLSESCFSILSYTTKYLQMDPNLHWKCNNMIHVMILLLVSSISSRLYLRSSRCGRGELYVCLCSSVKRRGGEGHEKEKTEEEIKKMERESGGKR